MGFAALEILFFHFWQCVTTSISSSIFGFAEHYLKDVTYQGVDLFLLISGMGMVFSIEHKPDIWHFYFRRIHRVWLPFVFVSIVLAVWLKWSPFTLLKNIFGINFYFSSIYSDMWFVTAILTFYFIFPFYFHFFKKAESHAAFTAMAILIWYVAAILSGKIMRWDFPGFTNRIPVFLLGIELGWCLQHHTLRLSGRTLRIIGIILVLIGNYFLYLTNYKGLSFGIPTSNAFLGPLLSSCGFAILISEDAVWWNSRESSDVHFVPFGHVVDRLLVFYGSISLELYLVQEFFERIPQKLPEAVSPLVRSGIYFSVFFFLL